MSGKSVRIAHLYPELLNLYGDSGNIITLAKRLEWRGLIPEIAEVSIDDTPSFKEVDLVFIGGGSDREQRIVCEKLLAQKAELAAYVADGGVLLAVCGGYQLLGHSYLMGDEKVEGLGLVDFYTDRGDPRLIGNIAIESDLSPQPIVGYENGAKIAKLAHKEGISLKDAAVALGLFTPADFDAVFHPEAMV